LTKSRGKGTLSPGPVRATTPIEGAFCVTRTEWPEIVPAIPSLEKFRRAKSRIGSARCSTDKQDFAAQRTTLVNLGVARDTLNVVGAVIFLVVPCRPARIPQQRGHGDQARCGRRGLSSPPYQLSFADGRIFPLLVVLVLSPHCDDERVSSLTRRVRYFFQMAM